MLYVGASYAALTIPMCESRLARICTLCKIEALFARERQLVDPSLACYRWITGINSAAFEVSNDTGPSSLVISGSYAALSIPVIQR